MPQQYRKPGTLKNFLAALPGAFLVITLTAALLLASPGSSRAGDAVNILFISSHTSLPYVRFIEETERTFRQGEALEANTTSLNVNQLDNEEFNDKPSTYDLIVSLGQKAALAVQKLKPESPVLYTLIPEVTYSALQQSGKLACPEQQCTAVYIDQPLQRLLHVIAVAFNRQDHLGVLLGPSSVKQQTVLDRQAQKAGFSLHTETVKTQQEVLPALNSLLRHSGLLLSIADPVVYNRKTAKSILLTTYRHRVPVIAYSRAYADAGATLSVFSTPEHIARQAADMIKAFFSDHGLALPSPQYPKRYSIRINRHVAESLGLDLAANPAFQSLIKEADNEKP